MPKVPDEIQRSVFERDQYTCRGCKRILPCILDIPKTRDLSKTDFLVVDHIEGRGESLDNLQTLCSKCNCSKAGKGQYIFRLSAALKRIGRPMTYYPSLARAIGLHESIFLCQILYWGPKGRHAKGEGWIYKSTEELEEETGLSYKQQTRIRKSLINKNLLEEHYERREHKLFFRVSVESLDRIGDHFTFGHMLESHMPVAQIADTTLPKVSSYKETEITTKNTTEESLSSLSTPIEEFSLDPNPPSNGKKKSSDPRHMEFRKKLEKFWKYKNPDFDFAWSGKDAGQLGEFLKKWPKLTVEQFHSWLENYSDSEGIVKSKVPNEFLPFLHKYADGLLDKFGKPLEDK